MNNNALLPIHCLSLLVLSTVSIRVDLANATINPALSSEDYRHNIVQVPLLSQSSETIAPGVKASLLAKVAANYMAIGQIEKANQLFSESLRLAQTIPDEAQKSEVLTNIASELVKAGKLDQVPSILD